MKITEIVVNDKGEKRRKSSVWSATPDNRKRSSIVDAVTGVFRKGGGRSDTAAEEGAK